MTHDVARWHANPMPTLRNSGDTVNAHQRRVAKLCHELAARVRHPLHDSDLIHAALHHDEAEKVLGDMPYPAKARFPALAAAYAKAELQVLTEMGLTWNLRRIEADMLHLCDRLDAYTWATKREAGGEEWDIARADLYRIAAKIGPAASDWVQEKLI